MARSAEARLVLRAPSLRLGLSPRIRLGLRNAGQFLLLKLLFQVCSALVQAVAVPLPGNLVGMLLLLALLRFGVLRLEQVQELADLTLKHLNFFFIPFAVGLMTWTALLASSGVALVVSLVGSMIVCLAVAGLVSERLSARGGGPDAS